MEQLPFITGDRLETGRNIRMKELSAAGVAGALRRYFVGSGDSLAVRFRKSSRLNSDQPYLPLDNRYNQVAILVDQTNVLDEVVRRNFGCLTDLATERQDWLK